MTFKFVCAETRGCRGGKPPAVRPLSAGRREGDGSEAIFDPSTGKGLRAKVGEDPFKCINNEKPVTGMSGDIGPVVTRAPGVGKTAFNFSFEVLDAENARDEDRDRGDSDTERTRNKGRQSGS